MDEVKVFVNGARCAGCNINLTTEEQRATFEISKAEWVNSDLPDPFRMPTVEQLDVRIERPTPPPQDPFGRVIRLVGWKSFKELLRQMWDIIKWDIRVGGDPDYATRPGLAVLSFAMVMTGIEYEYGTPHLVVSATDLMSFMQRRLIDPIQLKEV